MLLNETIKWDLLLLLLNEVITKIERRRDFSIHYYKIVLKIISILIKSHENIEAILIIIIFLKINLKVVTKT